MRSFAFIEEKQPIVVQLNYGLGFIIVDSWQDLDTNSLNRSVDSFNGEYIIGEFFGDTLKPFTIDFNYDLEEFEVIGMRITDIEDLYRVYVDSFGCDASNREVYHGVYEGEIVEVHFITVEEFLVCIKRRGER